MSEMLTNFYNIVKTKRAKSRANCNAWLWKCPNANLLGILLYQHVSPAQCMTIISHSPWTQPQNGHRDWQLKFLFIRIYHKQHNMHGNLEDVSIQSIYDIWTQPKQVLLLNSPFCWGHALSQTQHFTSNLFNWKKMSFLKTIMSKTSSHEKLSTNWQTQLSLHIN
jgi:hypothetical protein